MPKTLLITGASGGLGQMLIAGLPSTYRLIPVDKPHHSENRYKLEGISGSMAPEGLIKMDLSTEHEAFKALLAAEKPDCVIHLAGLLENQKPEDIDRINHAIDTTVLIACHEEKVPVIAMSTIMAMYGKAIDVDKIRAVLAAKTQHAFTHIPGFDESERLTVDTVLNNSEKQIRRFNPATADSNYAYIKSKMDLEAMAKALENVIAVRLGWVRVSDKHPFELEEKDGPVPYSELTACLSQKDFITFMARLIEAVSSGRISGYRCYAPVSECVWSGKSSRWMSVENIREIGWEPADNTLAAHPPKPDPVYTGPCELSHVACTSVSIEPGVVLG